MLLDTNFLIDLMEGVTPAVALARSIDAEGEPLRIPSPVIFELWVGAHRPQRPEADVGHMEELVGSYDVAVFDGSDARAAGVLQATLTREGKPLGTVDVQLAGMALARSEALVTGDRALARVGHHVPTRSYLHR